MISNEEVARVFKSVSELRNPSSLFKLQTYNVISRNLGVKLGSRKVYVDFPRVVYTIQQGIMWILTVKISQGLSEKKTLEDILNEVTNEKKDPKTELGHLTSSLKKLDIKWSCIYLPWYKKPVLRLYVDKYFKNLWIAKLQQFVKELNSGNDNPAVIYEKVQTLTPEYKKIQSKTSIKPIIFEIFLNSELSPYEELKHIWKITCKLRKATDFEKYKNPISYNYIDRVFMDIKTIIHQIYAILDSGYCLSGYILLRKLLVDFAFIIFYDSLINWLYKCEIRTDVKLNNIENDMDNTPIDYVSDFIHEWKLVYLYEDLVVCKNIEDQKRTNIKITKITDVKNFKSLYSKNKLLSMFKENYVDLKDKFLRQILDITAIFSVDVFEFAEKNYELHNTNNPVSEEYIKLCEVVHEPIHIDFPPFSSLLEYIGFLHHLRKVRQLLSLIVKNYKKAKKNITKKMRR